MKAESRIYNGPYKGERLSHVAFPLGGIGAGMICLEGTGTLSHVSLRGRPDVFNEPQVFSALCVKGEPNLARVLEGPVPGWKVFFPWDREFSGSGNGGGGKTYGLPRFAAAQFQAHFPFGIVRLEDSLVPLEVQITGWSPFVPGDADSSSLPVAALEYRFTNPTASAIEAVYSFHARNSWRSASARRHPSPGKTPCWRQKAASSSGNPAWMRGRGSRGPSAPAPVVRTWASTSLGFAAPGSTR